MDRGLALAATVLAGGMIALQVPINSGLGKAIGTFAAAAGSFTLGTISLVGIAALTGGFGQLGEVRGLAWYYLIGGVLGAVYVTTALVAVRTLGGGGVTAATIAGQLSMSLAIDRLGILGLEQRPLSLGRVIGVALLVAGTFLVVRE